MIRVALIDDDEIVRAALHQLISAAPDMGVVEATARASEAAASASIRNADVVLMDLEPRGDPTRGIRDLLAAHPAARVVVLTFRSEPGLVLDAVDEGAVGYLLKDADPQELLGGIRAAAHGGSPLSPWPARVILGDRGRRRRRRGLSGREHQVLSLLSAGLTNRQIARRLSIKEKTVKAHLTNVYRAIGVGDRTQAALWVGRQERLESASS